jgi:FkbM family methyltransferase
MLRSLINPVLRARGYQLKRVGAPVRGPENFIAMIKARGFAPGTVIDVGVGHGTPWLYQFPDAQLVLIEPNPAFDLEGFGAHVYHHAVGAVSVMQTLHVDHAQPTSSSLLRSERPSTPMRVPVKTLDATLGTDYPGPYLLKLDIEGYEREALLGATRTLEQTAMVICEMSVAPRFDGGHSFAELVALLDASGFRLYDVIDMVTLGRGGPVNYLDAAFLRTGLDL